MKILVFWILPEYLGLVPTWNGDNAFPRNVCNGIQGYTGHVPRNNDSH
jgi:hypothetical protein